MTSTEHCRRKNIQLEVTNTHQRNGQSSCSCLINLLTKSWRNFSQFILISRNTDKSKCSELVRTHEPCSASLLILVPFGWSPTLAFRAQWYPCPGWDQRHYNVTHEQFNHRVRAGKSENTTHLEAIDDRKPDRPLAHSVNGRHVVEIIDQRWTPVVRDVKL